MDSCLPDGWEEYLDESTGTPYFHNSITEVTQWDRPLSNTSTHSAHSSTTHKKQGKVGKTLSPLNPKPQQSNQQSLESLPAKRTTVKAKQCKKLANALKHQKGGSNSGKVHVDSSSLVDDNGGEHTAPTSQHELVGGKGQDYLGLVKIYNLQRPYLDRDHCFPCVLCRTVVPQDVFFPCEHRVVCRGCIQREQVVADYDLARYPNGHCNCPLCAQIIKLILPNEHGKEVEKYWSWVLAVKPELPQGFMRDFRHSAAIIQKVHIDENMMLRKKREGKQKCCVIS